MNLIFKYLLSFILLCTFQNYAQEVQPIPWGYRFKVGQQMSLGTRAKDYNAPDTVSDKDSYKKVQISVERVDNNGDITLLMSSPFVGWKEWTLLRGGVARIRMSRYGQFLEAKYVLLPEYLEENMKIEQKLKKDYNVAIYARENPPQDDEDSTSQYSGRENKIYSLNYMLLKNLRWYFPLLAEREMKNIGTSWVDTSHGSLLRKQYYTHDNDYEGLLQREYYHETTIRHSTVVGDTTINGILCYQLRTEYANEKIYRSYRNPNRYTSLDSSNDTINYTAKTTTLIRASDGMVLMESEDGIELRLRADENPLIDGVSLKESSEFGDEGSLEPCRSRIRPIRMRFERVLIEE